MLRARARKEDEIVPTHLLFASALIYFRSATTNNFKSRASSHRGASKALLIALACRVVSTALCNSYTPLEPIASILYR